MDYRVCANCRWRDSFTGFCRWRNRLPTPLYWCPAWSKLTWVNMLFSANLDEYEKFLEELMETP